VRHDVTTAGVRLRAETFGAGHDPAVLLVAGAGAPMAAWDDEFVSALAGHGRHVIRFDHRDTGGSTRFPPGEPPYALADLTDDAARVLDQVGVDRAHIVGASLGGTIAQHLALTRPGRVASLTLIGASPARPGSGDARLPGPALRVRADLDDVPAPDWADRSSVVEHLVALARVRAGGARPFDEQDARVRAERSTENGISASAVNHTLIDYGPPWWERLRGLGVRALVVHGAADPLVPLAHATALIDLLGSSELMVLPEAGHDLERADHGTVLAAIVRHTAQP
jgi:pimeloyl-ACP methyl ester carboxylesterase